MYLDPSPVRNRRHALPSSKRFEEHFGFAQEDKNKILRVISINGQKFRVLKHNFFVRYDTLFLQKQKIFIFFAKIGEKKGVKEESSYGDTLYYPRFLLNKKKI